MLERLRQLLTAWRAPVRASELKDEVRQLKHQHRNIETKVDLLQRLVADMREDETWRRNGPH